MIKNKEQILDKLFNEFLDKDLRIILEGIITSQFVVHNSKILMNNKHLIITDCEDEEIIICLNELSDVTVNDYFITFKILNQIITIDMI